MMDDSKKDRISPFVLKKAQKILLKVIISNHSKKHMERLVFFSFFLQFSH